MEIKKNQVATQAIKFVAEVNGKTVGWAYLYLMYNDSRQKTYGYLADLFVDEGQRGQGIGSQLLKAVIDEAKALGCYKLVGTSRYANTEVHKWYEKIGFEDYGKEFRKTLTKD